MDEVLVGKISQLKNGDRKIVNTRQGEVGVFVEGGQFYAYSNICAHSGGPACEGLVMPLVVDVIGEDKTYQGQIFDENEMHFVCPWHGWEYKLEDGQCVGDPRRKLKKFEVIKRGDELFVLV
jgi:nitrite reductase/ring-hydroxylating ferredoxin subunit